jgi:hypothetical protein
MFPPICTSAGLIIIYLAGRVTDAALLIPKV